MEKRAFVRIEANLKVQLNCNNSDVPGTITNLSKRGMFLKTTEIAYPIDFEFDICLLLNNEKLKIPVSLRRIIMSPDSYHGLGIEIIDPPQKYLDYIEGL